MSLVASRIVIRLGGRVELRNAIATTPASTHRRLEREYCQIEKLANLAVIPVPHGFQVAAFPVKLARASGAWARVVAFVAAQ